MKFLIVDVDVVGGGVVQFNLFQIGVGVKGIRYDFVDNYLFGFVCVGGYDVVGFNIFVY